MKTIKVSVMYEDDTMSVHGKEGQDARDVAVFICQTLSRNAYSVDDIDNSDNCIEITVEGP